MRLGNTFSSANFQCGASAADAAEFACADFDVLALDIENTGSGALTGFALLARISRDAPYRDVTPSSFTAQSYRVLEPAAVSPSALGVGQFVQFSFNVGTIERLKIRASGATATLKINASGYSD